MGGIGEILNGLSQFVPRESLVGALLLVLILAFPGWLRGVRTKQLRTRVREVARATTSADRKAREDAAMALAGDKALLLLALADEAQRLNQLGLAERALTALEAHPKHARDVAALRRKLRPEPPPEPADAIEALVAVRRLLDEGLDEQARTKLVEARARFPDDPTIAELAARQRVDAEAR